MKQEDSLISTGNQCGVYGTHGKIKMDIIIATVVIFGGIVGLAVLQRRDIKRDSEHEVYFNEIMENIKCHDQLRCMGLIETAYLFHKFGLELYMRDKKNLDKWFV